MIWYSTSLSIFLYFSFLSFYLIRRRRVCFDVPETTWKQFLLIGEVCVAGYLFHYIPYFFMERTLFLHHYLPAFLFKTLLLAAMIEHVYILLMTKTNSRYVSFMYLSLVGLWLCYIVHIFLKFSVISYGLVDLSESDLVDLRWRDTWDFILHRK